MGGFHWALCLRSHRTEIALPGGSGGKSASKVSWVVDRIRVLVIWGPRSPLSCWLMPGTALSSLWPPSGPVPSTPLQQSAPSSMPKPPHTSNLSTSYPASQKTAFYGPYLKATAIHTVPLLQSSLTVGVLSQLTSLTHTHRKETVQGRVFRGRLGILPPTTGVEEAIQDDMPERSLLALARCGV